MEGYGAWYDDDVGIADAPLAPPPEPKPVSPTSAGVAPDNLGDDVVVRRALPPGRRGLSEASRRSVVILSVDAPGSAPRAPPPAALDDAASNRMSRVFPDLEIQTLATKVSETGERREPIYKEGHRWPWIIFALLLWGLGMVLLVYGSLCAQAAYQQTLSGKPQNLESVCGPAGGACANPATDRARARLGRVWGSWLTADPVGPTFFAASAEGVPQRVAAL